MELRFSNRKVSVPFVCPQSVRSPNNEALSLVVKLTFTYYYYYKTRTTEQKHRDWSLQIPLGSSRSLVAASNFAPRTHKHTW